MPIRDFTELDVWKVGHQFRLEIYKVTKVFPSDEKFGLTSQLRRASSSFTANIAEGFGRHTSKDQEHFYVQAHGSIFECRDHLILARDLEYISQEQFSDLYHHAERIHRLMYRFLEAHRVRRTSSIENRISK